MSSICFLDIDDSPEIGRDLSHTSLALTTLGVEPHLDIHGLELPLAQKVVQDLSQQPAALEQLKKLKEPSSSTPSACCYDYGTENQPRPVHLTMGSSSWKLNLSRGFPIHRDPCPFFPEDATYWSRLFWMLGEQAEEESLLAHQLRRFRWTSVRLKLEGVMPSFFPPTEDRQNHPETPIEWDEANWPKREQELHGLGYKFARLTLQTMLRGTHDVSTR